MKYQVSMVLLWMCKGGVYDAAGFSDQTRMTRFDCNWSQQSYSICVTHKSPTIELDMWLKSLFHIHYCVLVSKIYDSFRTHTFFIRGAKEIKDNRDVEYLRAKSSYSLEPPC